MSLMEATAAYRTATPLRANSKAHQEDINTIRHASRPVETADRLVKRREREKILTQVDAMLFDLQGRRKRYSYNHAAAQQLEHLWPVPLDPLTQVPLWRDLLRITKERPVDRETFMGFAVSILRQFNLYEPGKC